MKKFRFKKSVVVSFLLLCTVTFLIANSDLYRAIADNWKLVYEVYKHVMTNYADQIDPNGLAIAGIEGMLSELDPYTVYLEKEDQEGLEMLTKGQYGGVGIQLGVRDDSLTVIAPMENTPAQRSGILPGDRIIAIDGEPTKDMKLAQAAKKIRGERGTIVTLSIIRYGEKDAIDFELIRDAIKIKDVSYTGMINQEIGYIRLTRFSKNSPSEMRQALLSLNEQDASKIIIDLRGNPGGLLDVAIRILDMLTEKGDNLLSTRGRTKEANRTFVSQSNPIIDSSISIAILIDGGSASASEIVAGALQDLDRGIILGTKSFGKGLVQTVFPLDRERSIKLTTAKYYIPSGRLIQRHGYLNEDLIMNNIEEDSIFTTKNGREVRANGGITPDIEIKPETIPPLTRECWRRGLFFKFASIYLNEHDISLPVTIDDQVLAEFRDYISMKDLKLNIEGEKHYQALKAALDSLSAKNPNIQHALSVFDEHYENYKKKRFDQEIDFLKIGLEREFSFLIGNTTARIRSSFDDDKFILKAIEVLSDQVTYNHTLNPDEF